MKWWLLCSNYEVSTNAIITFTSRGLFSESTKYTAGAALFVLCWEVGRSGIDWHNRLTNNEKEIEKWELSWRWQGSRSSTCQLLSLFILEIWLDRSSILAWAGLGWLAAGWMLRDRPRLFICAKWEVSSLVRRKCNLSGDAILFVCDNTKFLTARAQGSE